MYRYNQRFKRIYSKNTEKKIIFNFWFDKYSKFKKIYYFRDTEV